MQRIIIAFDNNLMTDFLQLYEATNYFIVQSTVDSIRIGHRTIH